MPQERIQTLKIKTSSRRCSRASAASTPSRSPQCPGCVCPPPEPGCYLSSENLRQEACDAQICPPAAGGTPRWGFCTHAAPSSQEGGVLTCTSVVKGELKPSTFIRTSSWWEQPSSEVSGRPRLLPAWFLPQTKPGSGRLETDSAALPESYKKRFCPLNSSRNSGKVSRTAPRQPI